MCLTPPANLKWWLCHITCTLNMHIKHSFGIKTVLHTPAFKCESVKNVFKKGVGCGVWLCCWTLHRERKLSRRETWESTTSENARACYFFHGRYCPIARVDAGTGELYSSKSKGGRSLFGVTASLINTCNASALRDHLSARGSSGDQSSVRRWRRIEFWSQLPTRTWKNKESM